MLDVVQAHRSKPQPNKRVNFLSSPGATGSPSQPNVGKRKKLPVDSVFNKFDDEEADEQPRKRKLVPLDYDDDKSPGVDGAVLSNIKGANSEEKRKHIKSLIEKIPTAKPDLFSYPLDWSMVDTVRRGHWPFESSCRVTWLDIEEDSKVINSLLSSWCSSETVA